MYVVSQERATYNLKNLHKTDKVQAQPILEAQKNLPQ